MLIYSVLQGHKTDLHLLQQLHFDHYTNDLQNTALWPWPTFRILQRKNGLAEVVFHLPAVEEVRGPGWGAGLPPALRHGVHREQVPLYLVQQGWGRVV